MADVYSEHDRAATADQEYRLTGPYGRMVQDAESKAYELVEYAKDGDDNADVGRTRRAS